MKSLAIDTSDKTASVAIFENDKLVSEFFLHTGFTHSQTLLPMIDNCLQISKTNINEIEQFVVTVGPGSFTGLRIGIATIKGFAMSKQKKSPNNVIKNCKAVSTLEALAYNLIDFEGIICPTIDARCNQIYMGLFEVKNKKITRLIDDTATTIENSRNILNNNIFNNNSKILNKKIFLLGNGANLCYNYLGDNSDDKISSDNLCLVCENLKYQKASGLFLASQDKALVSHFEIVPQYLKLCQAQRQILNNTTN